MAADDIAVARTVAALREAVAGWRKQQERIALVPTMGALHRGHLALVEAARRHCERVVASLFVNPKQFGPREDFAAYPRNEAADLAKFSEAGVDLVFAPTVEEMYQAGFAPDYLELRDAADLSAMSRLDRGARLLAAAHLGRTRLIDNVAVTPR